jgi:hypothetical protein
MAMVDIDIEERRLNRRQNELEMALFDAVRLSGWETTSFLHVLTDDASILQCTDLLKSNLSSDAAKASRGRYDRDSSAPKYEASRSGDARYVPHRCLG